MAFYCPCVIHEDTKTQVMWIQGSARSPTHPAVASLNLGVPSSSFPFLFRRLQKARGKASPTWEHKYLPVKKTVSHQSKGRRVGTHSLQMPEGAAISGGAAWPRASPPPQTPQAPLPTSFADEVQSGHLPWVTQHPEGLLFTFCESICLNKGHTGKVCRSANDNVPCR